MPNAQDPPPASTPAHSQAADAEAPSSPNPFRDPRYGEQAEEAGHVIHSEPHWSLEETQRPLTGWVGAALIAAGGVLIAAFRVRPSVPDFLAHWLSPKGYAWCASLLDRFWDYRFPWFVFLVFLAMFLVETLVFKTHRRHFDFTRARELDVAAWRRIGARWLALLFCLAASLGFYTFLQEYSFYVTDYPDSFFYARWRKFFLILLPVLAVSSVPYFWLVERHARAKGPVDEFLVLANCLRRMLAGIFRTRRRSDAFHALKNPHVHNLFRGIAVKLFWTALMLTWCMDSWGHWERVLHWALYERPPIVWSDPHHLAYTMRSFHYVALNAIITVDLTIGVIGYLCSMRLLDTQVTTAEPTLFGWLSALLCYPPINAGVTSLYLYYGSNAAWKHQLIDSPVLSIIASLFILTMMGIYAWGTVAFGLRFSNLTNRGVICSGPYKYVRHPAYITKNSAWWVEALPFFQANFVTGFVFSLHMLGVNLIYGLRAWTEERHLRRERHYQEYRKKVPYWFIPGIW